MTGRTDEKTGGQRRVAAPGAGTALPAGSAGARGARVQGRAAGPKMGAAQALGAISAARTLSS
jgi:hypothetical protein